MEKPLCPRIVLRRSPRGLPADWSAPRTSKPQKPMPKDTAGQEKFQSVTTQPVASVVSPPTVTERRAERRGSWGH